MCAGRAHQQVGIGLEGQRGDARARRVAAADHAGGRAAARQGPAVPSASHDISYQEGKGSTQQQIMDWCDAQTDNHFGIA